MDWDAASIALVRNPANWVHYPRLADIRFGVGSVPEIRRRLEIEALQRMKVSIEAAGGDPQVAERFVQGACAYIAPRYLAISPDRRLQHQAVLAEMPKTADLNPLGVHLMNGYMAHELDGREEGRAQTTRALEQIRLFYEVFVYQADHGGWLPLVDAPLESAYTINAVAFLIERSQWALANGGVELMSLRNMTRDHLLLWGRKWRQAEFEALTARLRWRVQPALLQPLFDDWLGRILGMHASVAVQESPFREMMRALRLAPAVTT